MAGNIRGSAGKISHTRFYRRENPFFKIPGILSRRVAGQDVSPALARIRTGSARRSVGSGGSLQEEIVRRSSSRAKSRDPVALLLLSSRDPRLRFARLGMTDHR